jgi:plasmid stability protein
MCELVISNLDSQVLSRLGERAALHGRTVESEARQILAEAVGGSSGNAWAAVDAIRQRLADTKRSFGDSVELLREDRQR